MCGAMSRGAPAGSLYPFEGWRSGHVALGVRKLALRVFGDLVSGLEIGARNGVELEMYLKRS